MSTAISLLPPPLLPSGAAPAEPPTVAIADASLALLAALADGETISATVTAQPDPATLILQTDAGAITITTALPLPPGTSIELQSRPGPAPGSTAQAAIISINEVPTSAPPRSITAPAPPPASPSTIVDLGTTLVATVLGAPPAATPAVVPASPQVPPPLPPDLVAPDPAPPTDLAGLEGTPETEGTDRAASPDPATQRPGNAPGVADRAASSISEPAALAAGDWIAGAGPRPSAAAGTSLILRVLALQPPAGEAEAGAAGSPPTLMGKVVAPPPVAKSGEAPSLFVETAFGRLRLTGSPGLPAGTRVALTLLPGDPPRAQLAVANSKAEAPAAAQDHGLESRADGTADRMPRPSLPGSNRQFPAGEPATPAGDDQVEPGHDETPNAAASPSLPGSNRRSPAERGGPQTQEDVLLEAGLDGTSDTMPNPSSPGLTRRSPAEKGSLPAAADARAEPGNDDKNVVLLAPAESANGRVPLSPGKTGAMRLLTVTVLPDRADPAASLLLQSPLGLLAVAPRLAAPPGTLLLLALAAPLLGTETSERLETGHGWAALPSALAALGHAAPPLAAMLRADLSPLAGGEQLAASFLLIMAALRNPIAWPGEAVARILSAAGHEEEKEHLLGAVAEARQIAAHPATEPWQVFLLPLLDGENLRPVKLYLKRGREDGGRKEAEENSRFVLEFELSRLGAIQLDGFVRRQRFDLILRGLKPLGPSLQGAVERIFHDRIAAAGYGGSIDFMTVPRFDIAPMDRLRDPIGLAV